MWLDSNLIEVVPEDPIRSGNGLAPIRHDEFIHLP